VNLYPAPNAGVNQFFFTPNRLQRDDAFNIRSDKVIVENKNNLFVRVSRGYNFTDLPGAMPAPSNAGFPIGAYAGGDTAQFADAADFQLTTWGGAVSDTHIFRSNLLLDTRIGFSRFDLFAVPKDMNINSAQALGISGVNEAVPPFSGGLPRSVQPVSLSWAPTRRFPRSPRTPIIRSMRISPISGAGTRLKPAGKLSAVT